MIFSEPIPFYEALRALAAREILPTALGTAGLRDLPADLRRKSLFSARTANADYLQAVGGRVEALLSGQINEATARAELQDVLDGLDYDPARGFPSDEGIPPAERGGLRDLSSDRRIRLVLETNLRQATNFGLLQQGNEPDALWQFPAWELVRIYSRQTERDDWPRRFMEAGGTLVGGGRMVARKDDDVWSALGDSGLFDDGLDSPFPPFAFGSGMGWTEVPRAEAIELGVIDADEAPTPSQARFFAEEDEAAADFSTDQLREMQRALRERLSAA